jgi:hypothetical protein
MPGRLARNTLAARGAANPEALAAYIASRARSGTLSLASTEDAVQEVLGVPPSAPAPAARRYPVTSPDDILIGRSPGGGASVRHRRGGALIGEIRAGDEGWTGVYGGKALNPHSHQRGALAELLTTWNRGTTTLRHPGEALQPPPQQTDLMRQYGIPAVRALATPAVSASSGARVTMANGTATDTDADDDTDSQDQADGLNPKGRGIYKKLRAKGWPDAKAMMFAKRAQNFGGAK